MRISPTKSIKLSQKESLFLKEITQLMRETGMDNPRLNELFVSRVKLSPDAGVCTVYFYTPQGEAHFDELLEILKLYKPSLRKALAQRIASRYTPELVFKFDTLFEKHERLEQLFEKIKEDDTSKE